MRGGGEKYGGRGLVSQLQNHVVNDVVLSQEDCCIFSVSHSEGQI